MAIHKLKTGVPGLDDILKGGLREKAAVLVSGGPGCGKTILAMQFLLEGAKSGQAGLCILYDTEKEEFLEYAEFLGITLKKYEKNGLITVMKRPTLVKKFVSLAEPLELIQKKKIKRVVLDSLTMYSYVHVGEEKDYRKEIISLLDSMKNVTFLATDQSQMFTIDEAKFEAEYFLFDGLIMLTKVRSGASFERVMTVAKMRGQDHLMDIFPFSIGNGGVQVYPTQLPFSLIRGDVVQKGIRQK